MEEQLRIRAPTEQRRDTVFCFPAFFYMMNQDTETETTVHFIHVVRRLCFPAKLMKLDV